MSFKSGTDDLRYSPIVEIIEQLYGKGYDIMVYDKNVVLARLVGKNKSFIEEKLPHISKMLTDDINQVMEFAEVIVITNKEKEFREIEIDGEMLPGYINWFQSIVPTKTEKGEVALKFKFSSDLKPFLLELKVLLQLLVMLQIVLMLIMISLYL